MVSRLMERVRQPNTSAGHLNCFTRGAPNNDANVWFSIFIFESADEISRTNSVMFVECQVESLE
jgi:hypothetical protein